jgi:peptidoglycan hydrolase CwlO-like protein
MTRYDISKMHEAIEKAFDSIVDVVIKLKNLATEYVDKIEESKERINELEETVDNLEKQIEVMETMLKEEK